MRISDWSSDVCSSDLTPRLDCSLNPHRFAPPPAACSTSRFPRSSRCAPTSSAMSPHRFPPWSGCAACFPTPGSRRWRSEEHTSELQSLMRISYAVFCLKKKTTLNALLSLQYQYLTKFLTTQHTV